MVSTRWKIGSGESIRNFYDRWLSSGNLAQPSVSGVQNPNLKVNMLL
jgi:hypothetical protein